MPDLYGSCSINASPFFDALSEQSSKVDQAVHQLNEVESRVNAVAGFEDRLKSAEVKYDALQQELDAAKEQLAAADAKLVEVSKTDEQLKEATNVLLQKTVDVTQQMIRTDAQLQTAFQDLRNLVDSQQAAPQQPRLLSCEYNLLDAGVRLNDPTFDNMPVINAVLRRLGGNYGEEKGWINTSLYLPAGACYIKGAIETPPKTGLRIRGNGLGHALNENHYWSPNAAVMGGPASRIVFVGEGAAVKLHSFGDIWDGVVVQRGQLPNSRTAPVKDGSIGIELCGDEKIPVGKADFRSISLLGFDVGFHATGTSGESHADETRVGVCWAQDCRTFFKSTGIQVTQWHFDTLKIAGWTDIVWDWQQGGGMKCDQLSLMAKALVFRLREPKEHFAAYRLDSLKVDGVCKGWRLLEVVDRSWLLKLYVWGEIGKNATPGENAIIIKGRPEHQFLDIDLVDDTKFTKWDWKANMKMEAMK